MTATEKILEKADLVREWLRQGATEKDVAGMLEMGESTFRKCKSENKEVARLIAEGKKEYKENAEKQKKKETDAVQKSLYDRCLGYEVDLPKHYKVKTAVRDDAGGVVFDKHGKPVFEETLEEVMEKQHVPADVGAIKFFLMNKSAKDWKSDPERLRLESKRVSNDTKRTKLAENAAQGETNGKTLEEILAEAEEEA